MEKRVMNFEASNPSELAYNINRFFIQNKGRVHEIHYLRDEGAYCAFLTYTPEGESGQEAKKSEEGHSRVEGKRVALWEQNGAPCKI